MPECQSCGEHVSDRYARVCGDNEGRVTACPNCPGVKGTGTHLRNTAPPQHSVSGGDSAESD
jgi:NAD-dependent SIR2 family protein deacetylase